jgi:hypothetical protein
MKKNFPRLSFATANPFRKLVLKTMGITSDKEKSYQICNHHPIKQVEKDVLWKNTQEQIQKTNLKMSLPLEIGRNSLLNNILKTVPLEIGRNSSLNNIVTTERQIAKENRCNDVISETQQTLMDSGLLFNVDQRKLLSKSLDLHKKSIKKQ